MKNKLYLIFQAPLEWRGRGLNECELKNNFISPVIITVQFDDKTIGYFLEKPLKGIVGDYELSGIVDGMVATVVRDPKKPFFCMHKYKRSVDNDGQPDAQALASMLVVKQKKIAENLFMAYILWV